MTRTRYGMFGMVMVIFVCSFLIGPVASADALGQTMTFFVDASYDAGGASTASFTLRAIGQNAYFYVDDRAWATLSAAQQQQVNTNLNQFANEFDTAIYPRATAMWGSEAKPGVDGDSRITVLVENLASGVGGYFDSVNEYPRAQAQDSNVREMVSVTFGSIFNNNAESFLAHEFQHLISFNQKELTQHISDDTWLNEARSEYDITATGYNQPYQGSTLQRRVQAFLQTPSDSLTEWLNSTTDYSIATVFTHYLVDRYGPGILASTIHSHSNGTAAIDEWLGSQGKSERFGDVFSDWMVASYLNDQTIAPQYGYRTPGLQSMHVSPEGIVFLGSGSHTTTGTIKEWQPVWLQFAVPNRGADQPPAMNIQVTGQAGSSWWGGADIATYTDGHRRVTPFTASGGQATISLPTQDGGSVLSNVVLALTQGSTVPADSRQIANLPVTITASLGQTASVSPAPVVVPTVTPSPSVLKDGDLIRRPGQQEVYVIWGKYRRYLPQGVLALYGFENRPVIDAPDAIFNQYVTSNYVRAVDGTKVYALWPDGTKHWINITPAQWDASGRDWGAIFIVNDAEVNFYQTGPDITR